MESVLLISDVMTLFKTFLKQNFKTFLNTSIFAHGGHHHHHFHHSHGGYSGSSYGGYGGGLGGIGLLGGLLGLGLMRSPSYYNSGYGSYYPSYANQYYSRGTDSLCASTFVDYVGSVPRYYCNCGSYILSI